ncbi:MAG: hypothetical protein CMH54_06535 [Myxococcales bacterium]|nr:hypothetical protein [Myxococcales bacterium]
MHRLLCIALLLCYAACSGGPSKGSDVVDTDTLVADSIDSNDATDTGTPPIEIAPTAPYSEPEPLAVAAWMVGVIWDPDQNAVASQLDYGVFEMPEAGPDEYGVVWVEKVPEENGSIGSYSPSIVYAATVIEVEETTRLIARADRASSIYLNGGLQPGDVYASGKTRVPFILQPGKNLLVVQAYGRNNDVRISLWTTVDELAFNLNDTTMPHLVVDRADHQHIGVPILNMTNNAISDVTARVIENDVFAETSVHYPSIGPAAVTQIGFELFPKAPYVASEDGIPVTLRLESQSLDWSYEREVVIPTVDASDGYRRTFRSPVDASIQYYGVREPIEVDPEQKYGLVLSLHGAGVQGIGQARSYKPKEWTYIIAPTNRRPFGFDWEEWGRLNGLMALANAREHFSIDDTRIHLTGHSMGGHGTWHVGVTTPGHFAVIAPSAGWQSFYTYGGSNKPGGPFARSRAHSDTLNYITNIAKRTIYIIHGTADDNVPFSEGQAMHEAVSEVCEEVYFHQEPDAGHWWDGDQSPGVDCVDWPPLFEVMESRTVDPLELDFNFISPSPSYSPWHSYIRLQSAITPYEDLTVNSSEEDQGLTLTTDNVRSMQIDGAALRARGLETIQIDGEMVDLPDGLLEWGPTDGKNESLHGPYNQVYHQPFCFVYGEERQAYAQVVAYMTSFWNLIGNGHSCALPFSDLTEDIEEDYNLIFVGVSQENAGVPDLGIHWDQGNIHVADHSYSAAGMLMVYPRKNRLAALLTTPSAVEHLLYWVIPFSSRSGMPDYLVWSEAGLVTAGFFTPEWSYDPSLGVIVE